MINYKRTDQVLTPADIDYWTEFYEEGMMYWFLLEINEQTIFSNFTGQGKKESYEWYVVPDQMLKSVLAHVDKVTASEKDCTCQILEIGCGTS